MDVLWLSHLVPWPPQSGVLQRSYNLLRQAAARHRVSLVAANQHSLLPDPDAVATAVRELQTFCDEVAVFPIPADASALRWASMTAVSFARSTPYDVNWLRNPALTRRVAQLGRDRGLDLVHVDTLGMMPHAASLSGLPLVLNHHNIESEMMRARAAHESRLLRRIYFLREARKLARQERLSVPAASVNVVVSHLDAERLRRGSEKAEIQIEVVPNGVDVEYFCSNVQPGSARDEILFVGGLDWYPNRDAAEFLVGEIWPRVKELIPAARLTVVGRRPSSSLRALAAEDSRIRLPGFVEDVRPFFDRAGIYVCPIRTGGGTRLKVLDALAMSKPLVATRFAVEGLGLVEGLHFLPAETPSEFSERITHLYTDAGLREALAREGREFVERHYSWGLVYGNLERAYSLARFGVTDRASPSRA